MIISYGRKYIFVHVPKTGGTSLSLALENRAMADDVLIGDTPKAVKRRGRVKKLQGQAQGRLWKHSKLADLEGLVDPEAFFTFTLVRNPWDRLVSYYHWLKAQTWDHAAVRAAKSLPFDAFLQDPNVAASIVNNPYGSYMRDASGAENCDLFARLEHVAEDLAPLEAHLGFSLAPLPKENTSARQSDYRTYYSDETAELVATCCAEDIARFGYRF